MPGQVQQPTVIAGGPGRGSAALAGCAGIAQDQQRRVEENLFRLRHGNTVFVVLALIAGVPVKTGDFASFNIFCML